MTPNRMRISPMKQTKLAQAFTLLFLCLLLTACSTNSEDVEPKTGPPSATIPIADTEIDSIAVEEPMIVFMTPWCGCCKVWAEQSMTAGFTVEIRETEALHPIKEELGVPPAMGSCHTAMIADYFIEGHVPFADIRRLLAERPDARGLTVPGMPIGSPGMEQGGVRQAYDVLLVRNDGQVDIYSHYPEIRP